MALCPVYIALDELASGFSAWWFLAAPFLSLILLVCEIVFGDVRRIKFVAILSGPCIALPFIAFTMCPLFIILILPFVTLYTKLSLVSIVSAITIGWCRQKMLDVKITLTRTDYLQKNMKPAGDGTYCFDPDKKHNIGVLMNRYANRRELKAWLLPISLILFALALVLEQMILTAGDVLGFFIVLGVLATPLGIYGLGVCTVGYYLWILEVHRFEKSHGARAYFRHSTPTLPTEIPKRKRSRQRPFR